MNNTATDIVFTGIGMITSHGCGIDVNLKSLDAPPHRKSADDYYVRGFNPAPHLSDRKVVKAVSHRDVLGLVAFEDCVRNAKISKEKIDPERTGLYVGAPPSACSDNLNYAEGVEATRNSYGELQEEKFGSTFRSASPTTLLTGLPNNVLCYGAKTLDARGPNSNYTALETSGHLSIIGASRAMRLGRLDCAIAGGYSAHSDPLFVASNTRRGLLKQPNPEKNFLITAFESSPESHGSITAEGAAFVALELREKALARDAKPFATLLAGGMSSDARGPYAVDNNNPSLTALIRRTMKRAALTHNDIEVVLLTGSGLSEVDAAELKAIDTFFEFSSIKPILACTASVWGNLIEAGGVGELGVLKHCYENESVPEAILLHKNKRSFSASRKNAMILRASPWGEYTCLVIRMEEKL
jgi:3-oxoacyl-(acyl-carrier-protein) synthase